MSARDLERAWVRVEDKKKMKQTINCVAQRNSGFAKQAVAPKLVVTAAPIILSCFLVYILVIVA